MKLGALAQYITISTGECARLPAGIEVNDGAAMDCAATTEYRSLLPDVVKQGAKIFVNGGSGGVRRGRFRLRKRRALMSRPAVQQTISLYTRALVLMLSGTTERQMF